MVFSEALKDLGVPGSAIILETKATNTAENIKFGMEQLDNGGVKPKSALLVGRPFMMKRIMATFKMQFPGVKTLACPSAGTLDEYVAWMDEKEEGRAAKRLIAEVDRLITYPAKGFMINVEVPANIRYAVKTQ